MSFPHMHLAESTGHADGFPLKTCGNDNPDIILGLSIQGGVNARLTILFANGDNLCPYLAQ